MRGAQISVFLENKVGRLAEVTGILADAGVNIRALSLADTSDFGVLRLIVDDTEKAASSLKDGGFTVRRTEVIALEVEDRPGGLLRILRILRECGINIEYMYAYAYPGGDNALMVFRFDKMDEAETVLSQKGIRMIDGAALASM